jgi:glycosyltransferase involved in cell wall biosynthesis
MRVLALSHVPAYGSGSGIYAAQVAGTLVRRGHEAALLTPACSPYEVPDGVRLDWIGMPGHAGRWTFTTPFPTFSGHRESTLTYDDLTLGELDSYLAVARKALNDVAEEFRPDVIHVNHAFLLALVVAEADRWPWVVVSHGSEFLRPMSGRLQALRQRALDGAGVLAAVSEASQEELAKRTGRDASAIALVPPGYDPEVFKPGGVDRAAVRKRLGVDSRRPCAAYIGRLVEYKRVGDLLRAVATISPGLRPDVLIMGDGPERGKLEELASALGLDRVAFREATREPERVADAMNAVDVVVVPSEGDPFPMASIEAMACGTPVIASDGCGTARLAAHGPGASYPTGDVGALGALLREACADGWKQTRGALGPAAVRPFTWSHLTDVLTALYERAGRRSR